MNLLHIFITPCLFIALLYGQTQHKNHNETETILNDKELIYACLDKNKDACLLLIDGALPSVIECSEQASCIIIAHIYMTADMHENALPYLKKSCYFGIMEACFEHALSHEILGEYTQAHNIYKQSCDRGFMPSCYNLAMLYVNGLGVQTNMQKANRIFFEACANNEEQSCYNLAISYRYGMGLKADRLRAKDFFKRACDLGMELGCKEYDIINAADFSITVQDHLKKQKQPSMQK